MKLGAIAVAAVCFTTSAAMAQGYQSQGYQSQGGFQGGASSGSGRPSSSEPFSFQGDQIQPMPDQRQISQRDPRYSQTYQQPQSGEIPKPGGGCLRYGAVGAAGGHLAGHGVLGALAGCATGAYVRHRDKARIRDQYGTQ